VALNATGFNKGPARGTGRRDGRDVDPVQRRRAGLADDEAYRSAMSTYAPEAPDPSDDLALAGYVAADEMIQGLLLAGPRPTRQQVIQKLRRVTNFTAGNLIPPIDLSQPKQPILRENFMKVDRTGHSLAPVPPPAALDHDGFWCGVPLK